jgi:hypothetical protein
MGVLPSLQKVGLTADLESFFDADEVFDLRLHEIDRAWNSVIHLMGRLVLARKEEMSLEDDEDKNSDIFSRLVNASDGSGKYTLDGEEVVRRNH